MKSNEPQKNWHCNRCSKDVADIYERCDCTESPVPLSPISPTPLAQRPVWPNGRIENELTGKSVEDKVDDLLKEQCPCLFGSINTETGEYSDGYMENGQMKFQFNLWESIKNKIRFALFGNPYKQKSVKLKPKIEVVCEAPLARYNRWTGEERSAGTVTIYRKFDPDTKQTLRIWSRNPNRVYLEDEYDVDIWDQTGKLETKL